jgi:beta-lactamase regulating signal transducer with metallopeptidase domain
MGSDLLSDLIRANLAGAAVALLMLALRGRLRPMIGPSAVYALWLCVPAAALASLLPARTVTVVVEAVQGPALPSVPVMVSSWNISLLLITVWLAGAALSALWIGWRQLKFITLFGLQPTRRRVVKAASAKVGPAVVGLISPRILLPADFATRFSPMQRRVVLAHEAVHLGRGDTRINACVLLLQCLCWFNPVAHLAARAMRLDQELSCDALVMSRFPKARRSYAEAMLKSQVDAIALPIGCYWPARGPSALSRRLSMLRAAPLPRGRMLAGVVLAGLMATGAGVVGWSAQPPRQKIILAASRPTPTLRTSPIKVVKTTSLKVRGRSPVMSAVASTPESSLPPETQIARSRPVLSNLFEWNAMPMPLEMGEGEASESAAPPVRPMAGELASIQTTSSYRNGDYQMKSDFIPLAGKIQVSTRLYKEGSVIGSGTATVLPGETAYVALSNGQMATVLPGKTAYVISRPMPPYPYQSRLGTPPPPLPRGYPSTDGPPPPPS